MVNGGRFGRVFIDGTGVDILLVIIENAVQNERGADSDVHARLVSCVIEVLQATCTTYRPEQEKGRRIARVHKHQINRNDNVCCWKTSRLKITGSQRTHIKSKAITVWMNRKLDKMGRRSTTSGIVGATVGNRPGSFFGWTKRPRAAGIRAPQSDRSHDCQCPH